MTCLRCLAGCSASSVFLAAIVWSLSPARGEVIYSTDFPDPDDTVPAGWTVLSGATGGAGWAMGGNGEDYRYNTSGTNGISTYNGPEIAGVTDFTIAADFRASANTTPLAGLVGRIVDVDNHYTMRLYDNDHFGLYRVDGGSAVELVDDTLSSPYTNGTWRVALGFEGDAIQARLFDQTGTLRSELNFIDDTYSHASGAGLRAGGTIAFEGVEIRTPAAAYEGFSTNADGSGGAYVADASIVGTGPPRPGFTGNWTSIGGTLAPHANFDARTTGLSYGALQTTPGAVEFFRTSGSAGDTKTILRETDAGFQPEDEIWGSFLFSYSGFEQDALAGVRFLSGGPSPVGGDGFLIFEVDANGNGAFRAQDGPNNPDLNLGPITADETHMVVFRVNATLDGPDANYDEISAWLDPDLGNLGAADVNGFGIVRRLLNANAGFDPFGRFQLSGIPHTAGYSFFFDELRLGTNFAVVAPVPEPSTYALGLLAGLAVGVLVRRRRVAPASAARIYWYRAEGDRGPL